MSIEHANILIVDDDARILRWLERLFLTNGFFNVHFASNGQGALYQLNKKEFGCVISDHGFTGMDGIQLLKEIRLNSQNARYAKVPFILVSDQLGEDLKQRALRLGASKCLPKSALSDNILATIVQVMDDK